MEIDKARRISGSRHRIDEKSLNVISSSVLSKKRRHRGKQVSHTEYFFI